MKRNAQIESLESRRLLSTFGRPVASYGADEGGTVVSFPGYNRAPIELLTDNAARTIAIGLDSIFRYGTDGRFDSSFGDHGRIDVTNGDQLLDGALDRSGNLYVLAKRGYFPTAQAVLYRYRADGQLDTAWAAGGLTTIATAAGIDGGQIAVQRDGKVVIAAQSGDTYSGPTDALVTRVNADGTIDRSFGESGRVDLDMVKTDATFTAGRDYVLDVGIVAGNRIIVIGAGQQMAPEHTDSKGRHFRDEWGAIYGAAVKLRSDGSFDPAFSDGNGYVRETRFEPTAGLIEPDGTFAIAGRQELYEPRVARFEADGSQRWLASSPSQTLLASISDLVMLRDGRIAVSGGDETISWDSELSLATISPTGRFCVAVNPTLPEFTAAGGARLATWGSALFVLGTDSRDSDTGAPYYQVMMKVETGSIDREPGVFEHVGASALSAINRNEPAVDFVYYDTDAQQLKYAQRDEEGFWSETEVIDAHARAGEQLSITAEGDGPWIAYYDGTDGDLKVAHRTKTAEPWEITTVDSRGNTGRYPTIRVDGTDVSISYYDASKRRLRYAARDRTTGVWSTETIDAKAGAGRWSSIATRYDDGTIIPIVAYTDSAGNLNYAERRGPGVWEKDRLLTSTPDGPGAVAFVSLENVRDGPAIAFHNGHDGDLMLAYQSGSSRKWTLRTLASAGVEGLNAQIVYQPGSYTMHVVSYNRSADRVSTYSFAADHLDAAMKRRTVATNFGQSVSADATFSYGNQTVTAGVFAGFDSNREQFRIVDGILGEHL